VARVCLLNGIGRKHADRLCGQLVEFSVWGEHFFSFWDRRGLAERLEL
jgi:hypothetical protein